jgi:hypothetical protein
MYCITLIIHLFNIMGCSNYIFSKSALQNSLLKSVCSCIYIYKYIYIYIFTKAAEYVSKIQINYIIRIWKLNSCIVSYLSFFYFYSGNVRNQSCVFSKILKKILFLRRLMEKGVFPLLFFHLYGELKASICDEKIR